MIKYTSEESLNYKWFAQKCLNLQSSGSKAITDGLNTILCKHTPKEAILFYIPSEGIIFHPRSGKIQSLPYTQYTTDSFGSVNTQTIYTSGVIGGWSNGETPTTEPYIYPIVDEALESFYTDGATGSFATTTGNYGNLYWDNFATDGTYSNLSWKGTPTRHFRLGSDLYIPGLSLQETSVKGSIEDKPEFTTFGVNLYRNGSILATSPNYSWPYDNSGVNGQCLILGALENSDGIFIVTQSDHYNAPTSIKIDDKDHIITKGGFWLTLWQQGGSVDGWSLISEVNYGRNGLPWFGNASGTKFVCSNGDTITVDGILNKKVNLLGIYKETAAQYALPVGGAYYYDVSRMSFAASYNSSNYAEFKEDIITDIPIAASFNASSAIQSTASISKTFDSSIPLMVQALAPLIISGPGAWSGNPSDYTATGGVGPYKWSYPSASCGTGTVSVSDCSGRASLSVRMSSGIWLFQNTQTIGPSIYTGNAETVISGGTKLVYDGLLFCCQADQLLGGLSTCHINDCKTGAIGAYLVDIPSITGGDCSPGISTNPPGCVGYRVDGTTRYAGHTVSTYTWVCP